MIEPKTKDAGTRRVWSDSKGRLWVSEWSDGNLSVYDPASKGWTVHRLPGDEPHAYAVYMDDKEKTAELAHLKGEFETIHQVSIRKGCNTKFQGQGGPPAR